MPAKKNTPKKAVKAAKKRAAGKPVATRAYAASSRISTGKLKTVKAEEIKIRYIDQAYKFSEARKKDEIHPRKIIPKVPRGEKVLDMQPTGVMALEETTPMAALAMAKVAPMAPTDTITLVTNVQLNDVATADTASHVCEPSAAINKNVVFYTGNWFAAVSKTLGTAFKFVDPFTTFPNPPGMGFCCDQVVNYIKSIDNFVWRLLHTRAYA